MKPIRFDGIEYGWREIVGLRKAITSIRDKAISTDPPDFTTAVVLSTNLAVLYKVAKLMKAEE